MKPKLLTYYYKGSPLFTCSEASLFSLCVREAHKQRMKRTTQHISKRIASNLPITLPKQTSRDLLEELYT